MVGTLADVDRAAEQGDATIAVELELDLGVRHLVPVNGGSGAAEVGADRKSQAASRRHRGPALAEAGALDNLINARLQAAARDAQPVDRAGVGLGQVAKAQLDRVDAELFGDLVEVRLQCKARLRGAVAALGAAGRLVGEKADAFEPVSRNRIGGRLQCTGVIGAGNPIAPVSAAVEKTLELHGGDAAVF